MSILGFWRFKDVSIAKKLYFVVGTMLVLISMELLILWFSIRTLSSVRAMVAGESFWSKAQKDAVNELLKYSQFHDENSYKEFQNFMLIPAGDHLARVELLKKHPNPEIIRHGFLEGQIHPEDIDGISQLIERFRKNSYLKRSLDCWETGDSLIKKLLEAGERLHGEINSKKQDQNNIQALLREITSLNKRLTVVEVNYCFALGEGSRWLEMIILRTVFSTAITAEISGLVLTIILSKEIAKGLNEIKRAAKNITQWNLHDRAAVFSSDEIGSVATAINQMAERLELSRNEVFEYAYIASHDLQEPLQTISNFSSLLQRHCKDQLDPHARQYFDLIDKATAHMRALIQDVIEQSLIGADEMKKKMDCNLVVQEVFVDMAAAIKESSAEIRLGPLPDVQAGPQIKHVFQNLIDNAIKFRKKDAPLIITISARENEKEWTFSISDNGIGIAKIYHKRIFYLFQKLHPKKDHPGTGIGLSRCKKIVGLFGGRIWLESQTGKGSTFYFSIPKAPSA